MDLPAKEKICEEIFLAQPILLSSVLALTRSGVPGKHLDTLLDLLIVVHLSLKAARIRLAETSIEEHEAAIDRFAATVRFSEGLGADLVAQSIQQYDGFVREPVLMAYVTSTILDGGVLEDPNPSAHQVLLVAYGIVSCIAVARQI